MAFDGIVIAGLVHELNQTILNTKISKIAQPENDELLLTCKGSSGQFRVSISANASAANSFGRSRYTNGRQDKSPAGTYILYGFAQTYRKRADHKHYPAPYGAHHPSEDRTPE